MKKLYSLFPIGLLFICWPLFTKAQQEAAIWYFGDKAGLDFNFAPPKAISNPNMQTFEGCSVISDSTGSLLFYSDGKTVWNKNHVVMDNGNNLYGDASSTHSSVIIQKPFTSNEYYIITADDWPDFTGDANKGVNYSIANMAYHNGAGKITSKNNLLVAHSAEKIAATRHRNESYVWVAIPECFTSNIHLFLVTEKGFELKFTYSNLFPTLQSSWGQIKFSPDGKHLALTWPQPNSQQTDVLVLDFNNATGLLNPSQVITGGEKLYGIEFSPQSNYVYLSTWLDKNKVCQCKVNPGTLNYTTDCKFYNQRKTSGQIQLGPDKKIYIANSFQPYIGVIQYPDSAFGQSGFIDSAITLLPNTQSYSGLPTVFTGYLSGEKLAVTNLCAGDTTLFTISTYAHIDSIYWYLDNVKLSQTTNPATYIFTQARLYEMTAIIFSGISSDTVSKIFVIKPLPLNPGLKDTFICTHQSFLMNAYCQDSAFYKWNTGSSDSAITASDSGLYFVEVSKNGCVIIDSSSLTIRSYPPVNLPNETVICLGDTTLFSVFLPDARYKWSTLDTASFIKAWTANTYWVSVTQQGCTTIDTFSLYTTTPPHLNLGSDTAICENQPLTLSALFPFSSYSWSTLANTASIQVTQAGNYWAMATNLCGIHSDTIAVTVANCDCYVWVPNVFTPNGDNINDMFNATLNCSFATYHFSIYDRWGQEIFTSANNTTGWNGTNLDKPAPSDVYAWKLDCELINGKGDIIPKNINGTVTLLR